MRNVALIGIILLIVSVLSSPGTYSQTKTKKRQTPVDVAEGRPADPDNRFGLLVDPEGIVPDSKCAECHPGHVRLMHRHPTGVGEAKIHEITQGMINLAVECQPDGNGSFTCRPRQEAKCFNCHAVSVSASTLSLIDLAEMKKKKGKDELLGQGCLTCHPPRGRKDHHLTGNLMAITLRASKAFKKGCGGCHGEGLEKVTGGGSPHDWLARHLDSQQEREKGAAK